jgi:alpha-galactosidase
VGWSSWNAFHCNIDEKTIEAISDAAVAHGLKQAGYELMNIDDCWASTRDAQGNITADAKQFPDGMKAVADHIHANGPKAGIYSAVAPTTCSRRHRQERAALTRGQCQRRKRRQSRRLGERAARLRG